MLLYATYHLLQEPEKSVEHMEAVEISRFEPWKREVYGMQLTSTVVLVFLLGREVKERVN